MGSRSAVHVFAFMACAAAANAQSVADRAPVSAPVGRPAASHLANALDVRRRLGLVPEYDGVNGLGAVKVAVLDYGFEGARDARRYLPEGTVLVEHYDADFVRKFGLGDPEYKKAFEPVNRHGRIMAQIVWAVTGSRADGPKFYLLNANGPTMLRRAVRYAIEEKVDLILFSGSFEGGGNGDGRGPIDRVVDDAVAANILWVNAAGNYGRRVYGGPVRLLPDGYLRLREGSDVASLRFRNRVDENNVSVTLTWNDYRDTEDAGTDKDLDVYVEDCAGRVVGKGNKVQISRPGPTGPDESRNPRERVVLTGLAACPDLPRDPEYAYRIRIRASRGAWTAADRIRVLVTASRDSYITPGGQSREAFEFVDASGQGELFPPADHPLVLTVGDSDPSSSVGPTLDRRSKPDVVLDDSRAFFTDGDVLAGTSNAAAYVAGVVTVLKAAAPALGPADLLRIVRTGVPARTPPSGVVNAHDGRQYPLWQTPTRRRLAEVVLGIR
jgi:hypothetical protein